MLFTRLKKGKILVAVSAFMALMMVFSVALPVEGSKNSVHQVEQAVEQYAAPQ